MDLLPDKRDNKVCYLKYYLMDLNVLFSAPAITNDPLAQKLPLNHQ
jgi:hypothetical protein